MTVLAVAGNEERYLSTMAKQFPRLPSSHITEGFHLAVYADGVYKAGVTLRRMQLADDEDITTLWTVRRSQPAVRLSRFWSERPENIALLLKSILNANTPDTFFYGLLSVPPSVIEGMSCAGDFLEPHQPLVHNPTAPTSDGQRLLRTYLRIGAKPLGPPAMSADGSLKLVVGVEARDAKLDL